VFFEVRWDLSCFLKPLKHQFAAKIRFWISALISRVLLSEYKHVCVPVGTLNINAYFQDNCLPGCFPGFKPANQLNNKAVETSNFVVATF